MSSINGASLSPNEASITQVGQFSFATGNVNVPGAADLYQSFLVLGAVDAPFGVKQIGPFAFDDEQDDSVNLSNEITDHWVEDNTAVQDHIGIKPVSIVLKGRISELSLSASVLKSVSGALSAVENKLSQAPAYLGKYAPGTTQTLQKAITQAQSIAFQIEQGAARVAQLASYYPKSGPQRNKQQNAFAMLSALRNARTIFTVYTPFQVFYSMAIEDVSAVQSAGTRTISNFTVKMKQLQFTDDISQSSFLNQYGGRASAGYQPPTSNGLTSGITKAFADISPFF